MPSIRSLSRSIFRSLRPHPAWLIAVLVLAAGANHAWAAAGRFQFAFGDIHIVAKDGRERPAHKGDEINEGESIVSAKGASAQLLMVDGGIVAIRQDTHLRIDEYKFGGKEDGTERGFFALLKGGLRSITGLIGKLNREHYRIKTPAATIGIRGTDSETIHLLAGPGLPPDMQPGTYNKVNTGATVVNGTVVGPNQVAYAPSLDIPAIILPKMPSLFEPPKASQDSRRDNQKQEAQSKKEDAAKNGEATPSQSTGEQTDTSGQAAGTGTTDGASAPTADTTTTLPPPSGATTTVSLPPPPPPTPTIVNTTTTTGGLASGINLFNAPIGYGGVGGDISLRTDYINATPVTGNWAGNGGIVIEGTNQLIVIDATTNIPVLIAETNPNGNTMQYTSGTALFVDGGMRAVGGATVSWGRYVGADQFVDNQGVRDPVTMNLMFAPQTMSYAQAASYFATAPTTNYTLTTPFAGNVVDQAGNLYTPTSGTLSIATGATANGVSLSLASGTAWSLSYGGSLSQFYGSNCTANGPCGLPLTAAGGSMFANSIVTGTGINTKGEAAGVLVGPNAGGAMVSFSANTTTGQSLLGTALLVAPGY